MTYASYQRTSRMYLWLIHRPVRLAALERLLMRRLDRYWRESLAAIREPGVASQAAKASPCPDPRTNVHT